MLSNKLRINIKKSSFMIFNNKLEQRAFDISMEKL